MDLTDFYIKVKSFSADEMDDVAKEKQCSVLTYLRDNFVSSDKIH